MKKIHVAFLSGTIIFSCVLTIHLASSSAYKKMDDIFGCKAQAIDNFAEEQVKTGKKYSEHIRKTMLSIDADACVEKKMYEYTDHAPRYLPSIFL